jgi:hypothetical protein
VPERAGAPEAVRQPEVGVVQQPELGRSGGLVFELSARGCRSQHLLIQSRLFLAEKRLESSYLFPFEDPT